MNLTTRMQLLFKKNMRDQLFIHLIQHSHSIWLSYHTLIMSNYYGMLLILATYATPNGQFSMRGWRSPLFIRQRPQLCTLFHISTFCTLLYQISNFGIFLNIIYFLNISTMPKYHASRVFRISSRSMTTMAQACSLIF